ncbi:hypothetical protein [Streptomyces sp. NPDC046805]|uniref:hypothetical protein n=1 Tax=Streptomyces sp. NPDC046805 TaxID=3155134 RepID=UPI0033DF1829
MAPTDTSPLVLHGRLRSVARLRSGELLLDAAGVRRRIPVAAIERAEAGGAKGRELTVVLTAVGSDPVTYTLVSRSAPAVREFAEAVRRALPVRDAGEARRDGAGLVSEEPLERPTPKPDRKGRLRRTAWIGCLLMACVLLVGVGVNPLLYWLFSLPVGFAGFLAARGGWEFLRDTWVLRTRGITVEGRLTSSFPSTGQNGTVMQHVYTYVDARGETRERTGSEGGAERVEIVYDPEGPDEVNKVGRGTTVQLIGSLVFFLLGVAVLGVAAVVAWGAVAPLFR